MEPLQQNNMQLERYWHVTESHAVSNHSSPSSYHMKVSTRVKPLRVSSFRLILLGSKSRSGLGTYGFTLPGIWYNRANREYHLLL